MKPIVIALGALALAACTAGGAAKPVTAYYDLGAPPVAARPALALRGIGVQAPSWLATAAMQYRLLYADPSRRESYSASRWAAPPAELLEHGLRRQFGGGSAAGDTDVSSAGAGCRLRLDLDEFSQFFDSPGQSRASLEARISLWPPRGDPPLARQELRIGRPAATADASGGVAAFNQVAGALGAEIAAWLDKLVRETPGLAERCRGASR